MPTYPTAPTTHADRTKPFPDKVKFAESIIVQCYNIYLPSLGKSIYVMTTLGRFYNIELAIIHIEGDNSDGYLSHLSTVHAAFTRKNLPKLEDLLLILPLFQTLTS
ncbi:hypothetical protein DPMN_013953 [Dreissena polymorpha]|uniref:Uncharacterized protein n=1 Tax=Dreissena polymorpha TaxID=45954 RepID=A0A9D4N8Q3_DREPO|nr:hypothetical protein DPMN_013953 [Dreissena polymorpha]